MRIRKSLHFGRYMKNLRDHYCQPNHSPWDVITPPNRGSACSPPPRLLRGNNSVENGSLGGCGSDSKDAIDEDSEDSLNSDKKVATEMMTKLVVQSPNMKKSDKAKVDEKKLSGQGR